MPQTRTIVQTVYQFDELSDAAKEKARDWYRKCIDETDFSCEIDEFVTIGEAIGIDFNTHKVELMSGKERRDPNICWSGFCSQGDGACFEGDYSHTEDSCAKIREHAPQDVELHRIADELARIQAGRILLSRPTLEATMKHSGRYYHENSIDFDVTVEGDDPDVDWSTVEADEQALTELLKDLMRWLYKQLDQHNDHLNSDEYIDESIEANEYEFDENGGRI